MANVGTVLQRISKTLCSPRLQHAVLEPAIADLQHDCADAQGTAARARAMFFGYTAFWRSLGWCLGRDAVASESRGFLAAAGVTFAIVVAVMAASELLFLHTDWRLRNAAMHILYSMRIGAYVGWSAYIDSATLMFGVPLAMFPALLWTTRRHATTAGAALLTITLGTLATTVSSGWIAPAVVRGDAVRQVDRLLAAVNGRVYRQPFADFDECPDCKAWPALIRGANAPLKHRYPGYPNYVAPEDRNLPEWHRLVIRERLLLIAFAAVAGLAGWWLGASRARCGTA